LSCLEMADRRRSAAPAAAKAARASWDCESTSSARAILHSTGAWHVVRGIGRQDGAGRVRQTCG
jgi:hypothetical protein